MKDDDIEKGPKKKKLIDGHLDVVTTLSSFFSVLADDDDEEERGRATSKQLSEFGKNHMKKTRPLIRSRFLHFFLD